MSDARAIEGATYVAALAGIPAAGSTAAGSARLGILAVANGVTDRTSPERQGMRSALLDGLSPLNILPGAPDPSGRDSTYSPIWDLHLVMWTPGAVSQGQRAKVFTWAEAKAYSDRGLLVSAMPGTANESLGRLNAIGAVINCPVVATFARQ